MKNDVEQLERIQIRAPRMIQSLEDMSYSERFKTLNLFSLSKGRLRVTSSVFKYGEETSDNRQLSNVVRSNGRKLKLDKFKLEKRHKFLTMRGTSN